MKKKRFFAAIVTVALMLTTIAFPAYATDTKTYGYDNLSNEAGDLVVGFLGGSITVADGDSNSMGFNRYATRVTNWFQSKYPNKTVTQVNAGIGGTGSDLGKYRVMTDIGAYAPDVVFVEYAVNDAHHSSLYAETVRSNMETIVRNLQSLPKVPVIVFLYSMHDNSYSNIGYTSIPDHQAVADYYGIETINFYEYMSDLVKKGEFIWDKTQTGSLTNDNIHPNALGHEQYGNYIISQLESRNILHKNNEGISRRFMSATKDTRDIKFADADNVVKTGTWEDAYSGQSDNKYEAIQSTAAGDSISFTYTSEGNDTVGATVLRGEGSFVIDEGTENEISGTFSVSDSNLPVVKEFASELSAGEHTVKIVNTGNGVAKDGSVAHLKLGRIIANGGVEVNAASTAANGDHIPASMPKNLIIGCQIPNFHSDRNDGRVSYDPYTGDYTSNNSYTVRQLATSVDLTAGGSWGCYGFNFARATAESHKGILYDNYTATAGTYVFKARVRALSGNPTIGATTVKSWVPTYDLVYGKAGFAPSAEWEDYKTILSPAADGFTLAFGHLNSTTGDSFLFDVGDGVYYAPEVAYDVAVKSTGVNNQIIAGGKNTYKAEVLNQIGITAKTTAQDFTWSVVNASGNAVDGLTVTPGASSNEATVNADSDVPFGTYYLKAVSTATNWQKTLPVEVVEGPADPYAKDHAAGEKPANLFQDPTNAMIVATNVPTSFECASCSDWTSYYLKTNSDIAANGSGHSKGLVGTQLLANTAAGVSFPEKLTAGKSYVYSFEAMNYGTTDSFVYNMALGTNNGWTANWSVERGADGFVISDTKNWTTVAGTLLMPGTAGDNTATTYLTSGFQNAAAGSAIRIRHSASGHPYFAEEKPYDITLTDKNGNVVVAGENTSFEAKILNQINSTGTLSQDKFIFTVGDAKGIEVDGLTVTSDGAAATVTATDEVAEGKYYLRAHYAIDADTTWTKTLEIEVKGAIANTGDFVTPEKPANLTYYNQVGGSNGGYWTASGVPEDMKVGSVGTATRLYMTSDRLTGRDGNWYATGIFIVDKEKASTAPSGTAESAKRFLPEANTDYVFSVKARSVKGDVKIGIANNNTWGSWVTGANDAQIGTDWTEFKTTLSTVDNSAYKFNYLSFGMVTGEAADYIVVDPASFYLAKEVAYEFSVTANASSVAQGDVIELDATLLNQIGTEGTLSQEFDWVAVTDDRTEYLEGFTFEANADDASKVTVTVADDVAPGEYLIVAQNEAEGVSKHYTLTVTASDYNVTELLLEVADGNATLGALNVNTTEDVNVIIAAYRGQRLILSDKTMLTPVDGKVALEDELVLTGLQSGDRVRVFVWDKNLVPYTMKNMYKIPVVVK